MKQSVKELSSYRPVWMGAAMLLVVFYHSGLEVPPWLYAIKQYCYGGVDLFVFASGLGCYCSYSKDLDPGAFYRRRLVRLLPGYWLCLAFWLPYECLTIGMPFQAVLGNLFSVQYLTGLGYKFNWYMAGLVVYYLLVPALYPAAKNPKRLFPTLVFLLAFTIPFWTVWQWIIVLTRLPLLFFGMVFGRWTLEERKLRKWEPAVYAAAAAIGCILLVFFTRRYYDKLWNYGLSWYPFLLIIPGLSLGMSALTGLLQRCKPGKGCIRLLSAVGEMSFEVYLCQKVIFEVFWTWLGSVTWRWLLAIAGVFAVSIPLHWLCSGISRWLTQKLASEPHSLPAAENKKKGR